MREKKCLNLHQNGRKCRALVVSECPENCSAKVTDPEVYIERLLGMLDYNKNNAQSCADLRKQIAAVRKQYNIPEPEEKLELGAYKDWRKCYYEDTNRGERGGSSEKDANAATSAKQKMKDNRLQACKLTKAERERIKAETEAWEAENGKLEKLSRMPFSRNKVDSYTGEPIE